ncbi:serine/threonine-protein phosphatase 6 regulatory ankyrin repeat subunit C-like [Juglans microcarpa x Juglans regia]|uniref:serine/threonine-protein phosphatase 6 regulatory ankyrin repeat subunit C-like n=1 Tax=Juglans microcarpa x Juglans regia TaxID=2249226 RepID=UPI001B7F0982|nr:serine/threonine-protein phosphatase 6 regulatory ankyrin repeat subunit C-like [Juglans microcarpa x Juglans regia]
MEFSFIEGSSAPNQEIAKILFEMAMNKKWGGVVEKLTENPFLLMTRVTKTNDTVLHLAVSEGQEKTVQEMIKIISRDLPNFESLQLRNNRGNTALHLAVVVGNVAMRKSIASVPSSLIGERNNEGESPLFTAVLFGKKQVFQCLYDLCWSNGERHGCSKNPRTGDTILHYAISEDHFGE